MRLAHARLELLGRERAERRRDARREDPARRDQLDRGRARADLLADRGPDGVGPVHLPGERDAVAVAAGDRERASGRQDPWPGNEAGGHRPRDVDARAAHPAEVPDGRHTRVEVALGVDHRLQRREPRRREVPRLLLEVGVAVELQVDVDVDQSRQQRLADAVDLSGGARILRRACVRADPLDPLGPEEDALALLDPVAVEDGDVRDVRGLRHRSIMPPEMSLRPP